MEKLHRYQTALNWTAEVGKTTTTYQSYNRDHRIAIDGKDALGIAGFR